MVPPTDVPEGGGPALVCVEVVSGQLASGVTAVVNLATRGGSANGKKVVNLCSVYDLIPCQVTSTFCETTSSRLVCKTFC